LNAPQSFLKGGRETHLAEFIFSASRKEGKKKEKKISEMQAVKE